MVNVNGMTLYYEEYGEGKDLVLVHPAPLDGGAWLFQTRYLAEKFHVIVYDQRCFGASDKPTSPFEISEYGADLNALIAALGLRRPHVVGLSLGGIAAQFAVLANPDAVDRVVLASTLSNTLNSRTIQERVRRFRSEGVTGYFRQAVESLFSPMFLSSKVAEYFVQAYLERSSKLSAESVVRCYEALSRLDITERLRSVKVPTLVIAGTKDYAYMDTKKIAEMIPGAKYAEFQGCGHLVQIEDPMGFNRAVLSFLG